MLLKKTHYLSFTYTFITLSNICFSCVTNIFIPHPTLNYINPFYLSAPFNSGILIFSNTTEERRQPFYGNIIIYLLFYILNSNSSNFKTWRINFFFIPYWDLTPEYSSNIWRVSGLVYLSSMQVYTAREIKSLSVILIFLQYFLILKTFRSY